MTRATSYRSGVRYAYPFGHGLSYSSFAYAARGVAPCGAATFPVCVSGNVTNTGGVTAAAVAQLYVRFPPDAGQPAPLLKGFVKMAPLPPAAVAPLSLPLRERDLSFYNATSGEWRRAGKVDLLLGASSADIRDSILNVPVPSA